jgi:riboflavin synthase
VFTGIIQETGSTVSVAAGKLRIAAGDILQGVQLGGSIAVNGVCLTVTGFNSKSFSVDVMPETLSRTNLGRLRSGDKVNLERPLALGGEVGGHLVQGHIDGTGKIISIVPEGEAVLVKFETLPEIMRYIVPKGFIAVDGASLTVTTRDAGTFGVSIVAFTRQHTTLADKKIGDTVNLEADIIGKYVAEFTRPPTTDMTTEFLQEHGFLIK